MRKERQVLGSNAFAAITAVEGLALNVTSKRRLAKLAKMALTGDERRNEILRAHRR